MSRTWKDRTARNTRAETDKPRGKSYRPDMTQKRVNVRASLREDAKQWRVS